MIHVQKNIYPVTMILSCDSTAATVRLCSGRDVEHLQGKKAASWQAALPGHPVLGSLLPSAQCLSSRAEPVPYVCLGLGT